MNRNIYSRCEVIGGKVAYYFYNMSANGDPIIVVNGGPGIPHDYLLTLKDMFITHPIVFYDPLGCGNSDCPKDDALWEISRFADEIDKIIKYLNISGFHLIAHSFGTMVAVEYALQNKANIQSLTLISPILSMRQYLLDIEKLIFQLPSEYKQAIQTAIKQNDFTTLEYANASMYFTEHHMCRLDPWPDEFIATSIKTNTHVRNLMWGVNDFSITGNVKSYEKLEQLAFFSNKILLLSGEHDFILNDTCSLYKKHFPNSMQCIINEASHMPHLEQPEAFHNIISHFLTS